MASKGARHAEGHHSLRSSVASVAHALTTHAGDAVATNARALRQDPAFCLFLLASVGAFGATASVECLRLLRRRRQGHRIGADMVHLEVQAKRSPKIAADGRFLRHLLRLIRIVLPRPNCRAGRLLIGHFLLLVMKTFLTVRCTKLCVYFLTRAIAAASWVYWIRWLVSFVGWTMGGVLVNSGLKYMESQVALEIRRCLTLQIHRSYMENNNFYGTSSKGSGVDNPDQRIAADLAEFSKKLASLFGHSFTPLLNFVLSLQEASKDIGLKRPLSLFLYSVTMNHLLQSVTPSLAPMVAEEQRLEGDFRHAHARLIAHAEEVAFLQGGASERSILDARLTSLIDARAWNGLRRIRKDLTDQFFKFSNLMVGGIFIHVPFMVSRDLTEAQRISAFRSTEELMLRCLSAFGEILLLGRRLDELAGYTHRITQLFNAFQEPVPDPHSNGSAPDPADCIEFNKVTVSTPDPSGVRRVLIQDLQLSIPRGSHVLVTGPNGCGKTSLFRVLAGLWAPEAGTTRKPPGGLLWLPQQPYLLIGTLRDQVTYPTLMGFNPAEDEKILRCLETAGIRSLAEGPEGLGRVHEEWNDVLSGGERQRVGFARLFYHRPAFAVLDECTSAINPDQESALYEQVLAMDTTVFSIAHRLGLRQYHRYELKVYGDGTGNWELVDLQ